MLKKSLLLTITLFSLFIFWFTFIALKENPVKQSVILQQYQYQIKQDIKMKFEEIEPRVFAFTYESFDGSLVNGQISYPKVTSEKYPVLIGISAMGRSYIRWWVDSFKDRPTVTQVNKISRLADKNGYVIISIDSRYHGKRKKPKKTLRSIMNDLHFLGNKDDYEAMIVDTVIDHRVLLDWIEQQVNLDKNKITVAGYSMGGQISLILASLENNIKDVISIVPPYIDDKTAVVAPKNFVSLLSNKRILLITADDDENASIEQNDYFYSLLETGKKTRIEFPGGHILPESYVDKLTSRFAN